MSTESFCPLQIDFLHELEKSEEVIGVSDGTNCWCGYCGRLIHSGDINISCYTNTVTPIRDIDFHYPIKGVKKHFEIKCLSCGRIQHNDFSIEEVQRNDKKYIIYRRTDLVYGIEVDRPEEELVKNLDEMYKVMWYTGSVRLTPPVMLYMNQICELKANGYQIWRREDWTTHPTEPIHKIKKIGDDLNEKVV